MPRYWAIAPYSSQDPAFFNTVWQFDLANNTISIGWGQLGDVSKLDHPALEAAVSGAYPNLLLATRSLFANMIWTFYKDITPGDIVIARRGRKTIAAVGTVIKAAYYAPGKDPHLVGTPDSHPSFLNVSWHESPRDKQFESIVFPMHTLWELSHEQYLALVGTEALRNSSMAQSQGVEDQSAFVLERYLEDFIVSNFAAIFKGELALFRDEQGSDGQQYTTDIGPIDILAVEPSTKSFVVIELKKGRPSDQVVGQVLRYMGWVKDKLCKPGQGVKGLVICSEPDPRLTYALSMVKDVQVKYYTVSFKLNDAP